MKGNKVFTLVCLSSLIMGNIPYQPIHATTSTTDVKEEQSTSVARKEVLSLFKDQTCTRLADGITQENIDQARAKVETVNQAEKERLTALITKANAMLQQFNLNGLYGTFTQLYFYSDGSYSARLVTKGGVPHSYIKDSYASIKIDDANKENVYTKDYVGNVSQQATTETLDLKEGYYLTITIKEPWRFSTNHNDELKQNDTNPYKYVVRNGKLERIDDKNSVLHLLGLGNNEYASLRVDYNSMKMRLTTRNVTPHSYFSGSYEKIEVLDTTNVVVYTKDFNGKQRLEAGIEDIPFAVGYKIRLSGSEQDFRVKAYQDDNTPQSLQLSKNKATLKIGASGLELMKSQNGSDLESEVISLFTDGSLTRLVPDMTQEKINTVKKKVEASNEADKEQMLSTVSKASNLLQQFNLNGLYGTFSQLYFNCDGSYSARLVTGAGQPHSYIAKDYATITVKDTTGKSVFEKKYVGNVSEKAATQSIELKEGYTLTIVMQEPSRFSTNHNDELKQNNSNPYTYVVRNGKLERIDNKNRIFHFTGLGDREYATLKVDYNSMTLALNAKKVIPHSYFKGSYEKLEVLNEVNEVVYTKDFEGSKTLIPETKKVAFKTGYKIRLTGAEQNVRIKVYDEGNKPVSLSLAKNKTSIKLGANGLEVMKSQNGSDLESEVIDLFTDTTCTKLAENVTQEKIDALVKKVNESKETNNKYMSSLLSEASNLLQQFTLQGLSDTTFAQLFFYNDGSNSARLVTKNRMPHSYIKNEYAKITVQDTKGKTTYAKSYIGNVSQKAETETFDLKEGYRLIIEKQEPSRFTTNHNDELKQNNTNPFTYIVRNSKLERVDAKNRTMRFSGLGNGEYASLKVDYNSMDIKLTTKNTAPHVYFSGSYEKVEILDLKGNVVYSKDFIGNKKLDVKTDETLFKIGYKIRLTGAEHFRVKTYDDEKKLVDLNLSNKKMEVRITSDGLDIVFATTDSMTAILKANVEKRLTNTELDVFAKKDADHKKFLDWLYKNPEAMRLYLDGGNAASSKQTGMSSYQFKDTTFNVKNEMESLEIWYQIWKKHESSHQGTNLKIAIATSLEFNKGVYAWYNVKSQIDPMKRYENLARAEAEGILFEDFAGLTIREMRNVVNAKISDEDMIWLRNYMKENKQDMINRNDITKGYSLIKYVATNPDTGASVQGPNFYGPNPTIKEVIKYGGVCGAMSKLSSVLAQSYGIPTFPIGQPGHCAYIYLDAKHNYQLGYDVFGWKGCGNANSTLPYIMINNYFSGHIDAYNASEYDRHQASVTSSDELKLKYLNSSLEKEPLNYKSWEDKLILLSSMDKDAHSKAVKEMQEVFKDYPVIVKNLENK